MKTLPAALSAPATALSLMLLAGCATGPGGDGADAAQDAFFANLTELCGQTFEGKVVTDDPVDADFRRQRLVMHVRDCSADEIRIPFHVGEDHSRTWVITRTPEGLRLKHDHRDPDGTTHTLHWYGGIRRPRARRRVRSSRSTPFRSPCSTPTTPRSRPPMSGPSRSIRARPMSMSWRGKTACSGSPST